MKKTLRWFSVQYPRLVKNIYDSQKGSAVIILAILFLFPTLVLSLFVLDSKFLEIKRSEVDDVIVASALAALAGGIEDEMAYGEYNLDKAEAERIFKSHLKTGLKLDNNFLPHQSSKIAGEVMIEEFIIYNYTELVPDLTCPFGSLITNTSIHVVISFPAKRSALIGRLGEEILIKIHRDVDNYYHLGG